jgi:uncharacterized membrane protein
MVISVEQHAHFLSSQVFPDVVLTLGSEGFFVRNSTMRFQIYSFFVVGLVMLGIHASAQKAQPFVRYLIQELPPAAGYNQSVAYAINDQGDVAGVSSGSSGNFNGMATAWHARVPTALGRVPGGNYSIAEGINASGRVCGEADDGDMRPLGCIFGAGSATIIDSGGNNSRGIFISDSGTVVGNYARGFGTTWLPVQWTEDPNHPGRYRQDFLPLFVDPSGSNSQHYVLGANSSLQVVGQVSSSLWSARGGYWSNDASHSLSLLAPLAGEWDSYANGINDLGVIVGVSDVGTFSSTPVTWTSSPGFAVQALPLFPGERQGSAMAINNAGVIIGVHGESSRAAVWIDRRIFDLQSLLVGAGWTINSVSDINNSGQIVGSGNHNGQPRGFVLTPISKGVLPR